MFLSLSMPVLAHAGMTPLSEDDMAVINGQDGLRADLVIPAMSALSLGIDSDTGATRGRYQTGNITLAPYGGPASVTGYSIIDSGASNNAGLPVISIINHLDGFRLGNGTGAGFSSSLTADTTRNFGQWVLEAGSYDFRLTGQPFYGAPATTDLYLAFNNAKFFYRQNAASNANIALDNLSFLWSMPAGTIDIDNNGLAIAGDATFQIAFDMLYKYNADQDLTTITANDRPLLRFGWGGTLYDTLLYLRDGGIWDTTTDAGTGATFAAPPSSGLTEGLSVGMRWNYRSPTNTTDFLWRIGHVTGDREYLEFGDWRNLEQATGAVAGRYGFNFPLIAIDALDAGSATNAGGSLCWGNSMTGAACSVGGGTLMTLPAGTVEGYLATGTPVNNRSGAPAMVHLIRNGNLLAWSNAINIYRHPSAGVPTLEGTYQWGLIYTLANINSNVYFYPGGSESNVAGGSRGQGALLDVLFMSQSPNTAWATNGVNTTRWSEGTHFMLADTGAGMGIGMLGSRFLLASDDLRIWLKNTTAGQASPNNWDGGVDLFSPRTRAQLTALLGGARIPTGNDLVKLANLDYNFEGLWNFRLSPPPSDIGSGKTAESNDMLAYSAAIRFRCGTTTPSGCLNNAFANSTGSNIASGNGSYISIEEPGRPGVNLAFADMSGDVAWTQGTLQLYSTGDTAADAASTAPAFAGRQSLGLANKLMIGASAGPRMTDATSGYDLTATGNGGAAGRPFTTNVNFGGNHMISWAIPAASMYGAITIMPQQ